MTEKIRANPFIVIIFTVFIDLLGFGILIPVIPILLADPASPFYLLPKGYSIGQGYILLGLLTAIYPIFQFFSASILGQLSDSFGRKRLLAISLAGTCLSYIVFAYGILTKNIELLFISRAFDGITGGNISIAMASIADVTKPENRAKSFGMIGAVFGLGFIIGPFLGGKLSDPKIISWFNAATPFWFAAILCFLNTLSVIFIFPETLKNAAEKIRINWGKSIHNIVKAFNYRGFRAIFASNFMLQAGFAFFTTFASVFLIHRFSFTQGNIGD
jgi:DHA1 family tetracycline resistance protein-like MFS transporter